MLEKPLSLRTLTALLLALPFLCSSPSPGQQQTANELIMLNVTVRNRDGQNLTGLTRDAFELIDEKQLRPVALFENTEAPLSIGILVDTSSSMQFFDTRETTRAKPISDAISELLELGNPANEYFVIAFDSKPRLLTDWKSARELLDQKPALLQEKQNTALFDACWAALEKLNTAHNPRRALLIFSDGQDSISKLSFEKLRGRLKASDLTLYAVGVLTGSSIGSALGMEGQGILEELADTTGGEAFFPESKKGLSNVMKQVALELRHKYRIGFEVAKAQAPNKWHRLKVRVNPPADVKPEFTKLIVRARQGYFTK
jgi:Ca-activated chloride channel homolog